MQLPFTHRWVTDALKNEFYEGKLISLPSRCGLFYCRKGSAVVECGGEVYTIADGDMYIYIPSTLVRLVRLTPATEGVMVQVDVDYLLPMAQKILSVPHILHIRNHPCIHLSDSQCHRFESLLCQFDDTRAAHLLDANSVTAQRIGVELLKSMGYTLCLEVIQFYFVHQPMPTITPTRADAIFNKFMTTLFHSYRKERDVAYYAALQNLTPRHFSAVIKECTGFSALHWITQMVITEAKQLLETSDLSIKEIATSLNFPNQSSFGRYFKLYVGHSPREYRGNSALRR